MCHWAQRRMPAPEPVAGKSRTREPDDTGRGWRSEVRHLESEALAVREIVGVVTRDERRARQRERRVERGGQSERGRADHAQSRLSRRASRSSHSPEPSREPSSTAITSWSPSVWRHSEANEARSQGAASRTGTRTDTGTIGPP